ncbi:class I SAM-dependent methyltransferase [Neisseria sp. ZJ106]|uniref:Class I SAM-dependent methyltransferase n=1 Tax=Neisseria lisongii TaxID=2912188 RepID=A0ABY7RM65_9NEIS|nr:class I SAM-dependent methyltransferase [Neisseria lisongii]MCF7522196.1 class I SAM-dependent methyltransferase [Neisseria lisongii]WCL71841.1 class I SAM-dependent methyltransferase [Neisseria lisongii]
MADLISDHNGVSWEWRNESTQKPPKQVIFLREAGADKVLKAAYEHTAVIWQGDFHQAKQVLAAIKKRLRRPAKTGGDIQTAFHTHRMQQAQQSRILNMLAVEIDCGFQLSLPRAPDVKAALADVYETENTRPFLLPLNQLLGFIGAHEWHKKGIDLPQLNGKIHVPFGVFSPLRGEYLDLIAQAPINGFQTAFDIGTGSGVIAALLAKRGISHITATDTNPRAIRCARANFQRLGCAQQVTLTETDLFPAGKADLIVCNPPWLPAKPTSTIETALYDPDHAMLKAFLNGVSKHLNDNGEAWLVISDLAEHLHLRNNSFLTDCFQTASLEIIDTLHTRPAHKKAADPADPLAFARSQETTFLYRLRTCSS